MKKFYQYIKESKSDVINDLQELIDLSKQYKIRQYYWSDTSQSSYVMPSPDGNKVCYGCKFSIDMIDLKDAGEFLIILDRIVKIHNIKRLESLIKDKELYTEFYFVTNDIVGFIPLQND